MRRNMMIFLLVLAPLSVNAQNMYRVTGNNVNVRKGPGKNYAVLTWEDFYGKEQKWQLDKTDVVRYLGKKKNGFMYVEAYQPVAGSIGQDIERGWVSTEYLKLMTRKCHSCNGRGYFNRPCDEYPDEGYGHGNYCACSHVLLTPNGDWPGGKVICKKCKGHGYL